MHPGDEKGGGVVMEIDSIKIHPNYQPFTFENDVALIKLKKVMSKIKLVALAIQIFLRPISHLFLIGF